MDSSFLDALGTDHILGSGQLERHFNLTEAEAQDLGVRVFTVEAKKTKGSRQQATYHFVIRKGKHPPNDGATLRHITGAAEMRYHLGVPHDVWLSDAGRRWAKNKPDATWTTPEGLVAIEYDSGAYDPETIIKKLTSFESGYAKQIWGTPSKHRVGHIKDMARNIVPDLQIFYAPWY